MSIEMKNPKTVEEKIDAAANLVEQMYLAHMIHDEVKFKEAHSQAGSFLFDALRQLEEEREAQSDGSVEDKKK
jgi:hypothetical protein